MGKDFTAKKETVTTATGEVSTAIMLHGKPYTQVPEKIKECNNSTMVPRYSIKESGFISFKDSTIPVWRVVIDIEGKQFIGHASIGKQSTNAEGQPVGADSTNPLECAETSAIGRALSFAGYGIVHGIASAEDIIEAERRASMPSESVEVEIDTSSPLFQAAVTQEIEDRQKGERAISLKLDEITAKCHLHGIESHILNFETGILIEKMYKDITGVEVTSLACTVPSTMLREFYAVLQKIEWYLKIKFVLDRLTSDQLDQILEKSLRDLYAACGFEEFKKIDEKILSLDVKAVGTLFKKHFAKYEEKFLAEIKELSQE